jgi:hypothetical protein
MEETRLPNPLNTDSTTMSAATPIVTPVTDIPEMIETNFRFFLLNKYRRAIRRSYLIMKNE